MTSASIRQATVRDQAAIKQIVHDAYLPWVQIIGTRPGPMDADVGAQITDGHAYVAENDQIVGIIVLVPEPGVLCIENVAVAPACQGRGIGRALLGFAETKALELGSTQIRLFTHERMASNIDRYHALGFEVTAREPIDVGYLVHMRKALSPPPDA